MTDFKRYPCHCCGYLTMDHGGTCSFDICPICKWEDDNVQLGNPDFTGGANKMSLNQAKANFAKYGAKSFEDVKRARKPLPEEIPQS